VSQQAAPPASYSLRPVADLVPYARNARTHSDVQVAQIAASIKEFGFINPVIIEADGGIIAGHGRVLAAHKLGLTQVPTLEVGWLSEAQKRAYILADNKLAENAGWDADMLRIELQDLKDLDFDISLTGFADLELTDILAQRTTGNSDPDDVPEEQAEVITEAGDVWICGRHRIICGDSTNQKTVDALLGLVKPHLMVTDPPYGVEYDPKWRAEAGVNNNKDKLGSVANDDRADWREAWALFPGNVCYIWHAGKYSAIVQQSIESVGFEVRSQIIWVKDRFALSRGHYHWQHEPCLYCAKGANAHWCGDRSQSTTWNIKSREDGGHKHGTQKPVECMRKPIENNSSPGQAVYDPFGGSGTTMIAAETTGRCAYLVELNPSYVDVTVRRWQTFAGASAVRESDGLTFEEVENGRHPRTED